ncbi:MAG: hypothetical protein ACRD7F_06280, partial [Nitrososphaeraceae archaeon]
AGLIFSLLAMAGIGVLLFSSLFSNAELKPSLENIVNKIGNGMLTYYSPVFILLGLTLAGSIIGALSLARREEESDQPPSETSPASPQQEKIYLDKKSEGKGAGISND